MKNEQMIDSIVEGIQERKGKNIVIIDLNNLKQSPCSYFVICEGDSSVHVNSIASFLKDWLKEKINAKLYASDGFENGEWIAMDYGQTIVHVFQKHTRTFYDIEHLWADANIITIEDN